MLAASWDMINEKSARTQTWWLATASVPLRNRYCKTRFRLYLSVLCSSQRTPQKGKGCIELPLCIHNKDVRITGVFSGMQKPPSLGILLTHRYHQTHYFSFISSLCSYFGLTSFLSPAITYYHPVFHPHYLSLYYSICISC